MPWWTQRHHRFATGRSLSHTPPAASAPWHDELVARFGPGRVLERKQGRPSVLEFADRDGGRCIVKLWWQPRLHGAWRWSGAARRRADFVVACRRLRAAGIVAPEPAELGGLGPVCWVRYPKIPGRTLREAAASQGLRMAEVGAFLCAFALVTSYAARLPGSADAFRAAVTREVRCSIHQRNRRRRRRGAAPLPLPPPLPPAGADR